jgi:hypothetical protein
MGINTSSKFEPQTQSTFENNCLGDELWQGVGGRTYGELSLPPMHFKENSHL